jgi:hypothetical protein
MQSDDSGRGEAGRSNYWAGQSKMGVYGKNVFNVSIRLSSVQITYALLHQWELSRFVNPRSKEIASA